jgi:hypothetical protein
VITSAKSMRRSFHRCGCKPPWPVCGRLAPGHATDLLVVHGDPTRDLAALFEITAVYRDGDQVAGPSTRPAPAHPDGHERR